MSPTISAVSKRRVLSEMNRTLFSLDSSLDSLDSEVLNPVLHRWESPKIVSNLEESHADERESSPLEVYAKEKEEVERQSESELPPYDPKVNYLSPRPRFLRYRPKPRMEIFFNGDGDLKLEEESVSSPKSEGKETGKEEIESLADSEEDPEELTVSRSSWKMKSLATLVFFMLIVGLGGLVSTNPPWISSSSSEDLDLQKLPAKFKNWSLDFAVNLRDEDFDFFYSLDQEYAYDATEESTEIETVIIEEEEVDDVDLDDEEAAAEVSSGMELAGENEERETGNAMSVHGSVEEDAQRANLSLSKEEVAGEEREKETDADHGSAVEEKEGTNLSPLTKEETQIVSGEYEERVTDGRVHLSLPSLEKLLGVFSALLALVAIAIAVRVKQKHEKSSSDEEETVGNYSPEMSSSGRRERPREGTMTVMGLRKDSITTCSPSYGSFTTFEKLSGKKVKSLWLFLSLASHKCF